MKIFIFTLLKFLSVIYAVERITYLSTEHPTITYVDNNVANSPNFTATRYGRRNPVYYLGMSFNLLVPLGDNLTLEFYFYEFLTNVYKRSFVEMHYKLCDLLTKDMFFGAAIRQNPKLAKGCPLLPGVYHLRNMTVPPSMVTSSFPIQKGRCELNISLNKKLIAHGYADFEVKQIKISTSDNKITFSKALH